ncbi:MAG TPA: anti-sigma factor [Methylibium sp.]
MDYGRPALADRLAAEYALGTLRGGARRRFESLLAAHPMLRQAVRDWQARLMPLSGTVQPIQPSPAVWQRVEQRLFGDGVGMTIASPRRWWQRLGLWQGAAGLAAVAAIGLGLLLSQPQPTQPPIVIVMAANPQAGAGAIPAASFVASVSADGRALVLKPIGAITLDASRQALELWAVPSHGAPRSLGLVSPQQATTVLRAHLLQDTAAFAVSMEPPGGSPTGAPTGPILSLGKLRS